MRLPILFLNVAAWACAADLVIQNAKILTVTKGRLDGAILIRDGKIAEVAAKVLVPPGAEVLDVAGMYVMPGIIDCHSHAAAESINEGSVSVSSMVGIEDVLDPNDIAIYRALAGGATTANVLHGSANAIGGKCQVIKMRWGKDAAGAEIRRRRCRVSSSRWGKTPSGEVSKPLPEGRRRRTALRPGIRRRGWAWKT